MVCVFAAEFQTLRQLLISQTFQILSAIALPPVCLTRPFVPFLTSLPYNRINNLRVFNRAKWFESHPRLHFLPFILFQLTDANFPRSRHVAFHESSCVGDDAGKLCQGSFSRKTFAPGLGSGRLDYCFMDLGVVRIRRNRGAQAFFEDVKTVNG